MIETPEYKPLTDPTSAFLALYPELTTEYDPPTANINTMSLPTTSRNWRRGQDSKSIELVSETLPKTLSPTEVLLRIHAVSLNHRDVAML